MFRIVYKEVYDMFMGLGFCRNWVNFICNVMGLENVFFSGGFV